MIDRDEAAVALSAAVLRSSQREIEALGLEALAADAAPGGLDKALRKAAQSERREGAFGMEIVGAILIPVLVEATRKFWSAYSEELVSKLGTSAADATVEKLKNWFRSAPLPEQQAISEELGNRIRTVGTERGLKPDDIDALVAATAPNRLGAAFAAT